jgi:hypothetical protein
MAGGLTLAAQIAASLIPPGGIGAFFLIRRERAKFRQEELAAHANVIQADAQAEVLLSGEARALYTAARADADDARRRPARRGRKRPDIGG